MAISIGAQGAVVFRTRDLFKSGPPPIGSRSTRRTLRVAAEEPKFQGEVLREFNEGDGSVKKSAPAAPVSADGTFYNDENPEPPRPQMSKEYQKRLRDEYLAFGGSENTAMGGNYFLYIIVIISVLAVLSWLTGAI